MTCPAPTISGPRTFWTFQKMACNGQANYCGILTDCTPKDIKPGVTEGWLRSVVYTLLGTDRAQSCIDRTQRRRGDPADAFRKVKSGNDFYKGYSGTATEQLNKLAADLQSQIAGYFDRVGIAASVTVKASFAGSGQAQLYFSVNQESITVGAKRSGDKLDFVWGRI